jgi:hypothetical protein
LWPDPTVTTSNDSDVVLKADAYPYAFWHSTLRVIVADWDHFNSTRVREALAENGGAAAIRTSRYAPDPALAGTTLREFAAARRCGLYQQVAGAIQKPADETGGQSSERAALADAVIPAHEFAHQYDADAEAPHVDRSENRPGKLGRRNAEAVAAVDESCGIGLCGSN